MSPAAESLQLLAGLTILGWLLLPARGRAPESHAAVTADGWTFLPDGDGIQLLPPDWRNAAPPGRTSRFEDLFAMFLLRGIPRDRRSGRPVAAWKPGEHLDQGDLRAARVVAGDRGEPGARLEALGRDGDYRAWPFADEAGAQAALALLEARIVRPVHAAGEWGAPAEAFEDAWRALDETRRELSGPYEGWYTSMAGGWR